MTSVFSSIVRPPKLKRSTSNLHTSADVDSSQSSIESVDPDEPNLRELNASLQALTDIFPDIQPEVFREMLSSFSEESRLEVITETLLKHGAKWVRGRYRMPSEQEEEQRVVSHKYKYRVSDSTKDTRGHPLAIEETFRSQKYREAAKEALYQEFKGLSHSTIKAVLAEYNWSYTQARPTLLGLVSKSWRYSITSFLMRRKPPSAKDHPLVVWSGADAKAGRLPTPLLIKTKSKELNKELHDTLIVPVLHKQRTEQIQGDQSLAHELNEAEAEEAGEMYDCECCFIPNTLEQMSACDVQGHYICFRCIRHSINAALYDQGWARNINTERCTLRCIAPLSDGVDDCPGCIGSPFIHRALLEEKDGEDTFQNFNERLSSEALLKSQLPLIRCPFCPYAEVDELALPNADLTSNLRLRLRPLLTASLPLIQLLCFVAIGIAFRFLLLFIFFIVSLNFLLPRPLPLFPPLRAALHRIHLKRRGFRFKCLAPTCSRTSCLSCSAPWHDPHACYSSQLQSLRLTLERATTDAVKRTCPNCNLGFVKSEGCNKLVCLCGYSMCYVCREGLAIQGYSHFCQHFRERPGENCKQCERCDLYRVEDEEKVVKRARERAEREWWDKQGDGAGEGLKVGVGRGLKEWQVGGSDGGFWNWKKLERWLEKVLDVIVV
ncbi:uncharacterized protein BDR25DRAFT_278633 [Lindgomyces ingoldianus]|uniref:Uncharacterized protein n=1 Tax=Lindgomyces ingoldianus TaxID=673940 RepID=A0ACB6R9C7_9PLEO|nr:uncharacterized protein BDR25DRAFT_278633 [Lindgomyces ingoldianus]KAF2475888.1 hypothetical protein BDR25DRAFT_278633 [Lindgomyces ingoldianus]